MSVPRAISMAKLSGGIGLLKATMFPGAVGIDVAHAITKAIRELQECTRLIVDLRGNTGGGIGGLRLMSFLTPHKLPVGYSLTKRRAEEGYDREKLPRFARIPSRCRGSSFATPSLTSQSWSSPKVWEHRNSTAAWSCL